MSLSRFPRPRHISSPARPFSTSARASAGLSPLARPVATEISAKWKGTSMTGGTTKNFIGGQFAESKTDKWLEAVDPVCPLVSLPRCHTYPLHRSRPKPCSPRSHKRPAKNSNRPSMPLLMLSNPGVGLASSPVSDLSLSKSNINTLTPNAEPLLGFNIYCARTQMLLPQALCLSRERH